MFTFNAVLFFFEEDRLVVELDSMFSQPLRKTKICEHLLDESREGLFINLNFRVAIDEILLVDEG
jgi:hypothetical protein